MRIAVSNQKGGAGKTTTALNLAGALNQAGADVLLVDLDPQGHATEGAGFEDAFRAPGVSLYDTLVDLDEIDRVGELVRPQSAGEFDVLPSHQMMINIEDDLQQVRRREERLSLVLDELGDGEAYDHTLIDCPPNLGILTDNALLAAGNIVIPAQARTTSIRALELLIEQKRALGRAFDTDIREIALVANEVTEDNEAAEMMEWFRDRAESRGIPVFEIRKRVALQRAWNAGVSIFEYDPECDMCDEYLRLAARVEEAEGQ